MSALTNYAERKILDFFLKGTSVTLRTAATACAASFSGTLKWSAALFTAAPTEDGVVSEVSTSGTDYARVLVTASTQWATAASTTNDTTSKPLAADIVFTAASTSAAWGTITHWGLYDEDGNLWYVFPLTTAVTIGAGVTDPTLKAGEHTITLD